VPTSDTRQDIETRADCERLVRAFYGRALEDPVIGWLFTDVARLDLESHVPRITNFWETILLGAQSYGGGAFRPHIELKAKAHATRVAGAFESRLRSAEAQPFEFAPGIPADDEPATQAGLPLAKLPISQHGPRER
jgi:truncated hemoglobin YjbI